MVYVPDASRAVSVATSLLSPNLREDYVRSIRTQYEEVRGRRAARNEARNLVPLDLARANPLPIDWDSYAPPAPIEPGIQVFEDIPIQDVARYTDWTFFFHA